MGKIALGLLIAGLLQAQEVGVGQLFNVKHVTAKQVETGERFETYGVAVTDPETLQGVTLRFSGYVEKLFKERPFEPVEKGEVLAWVYSPEVDAAKEELLRTAQYARRTGGTEAAQAQQMLDAATARLRLLGLPRSVMEAAMRGEVQELVPVLAPASGYILEKTVIQGGFVKAGEPLFTIASLDPVWVEAKVYEHQLSRIVKGMAVTLRFTALKEPVETTVREIYPAVDAKSKTITVRLELPNKTGQIYPGMYASVTFHAPRSARVVLPRSAIFRREGQSYVMKPGEWEGEYDPVAVEVAPLNEEEVEVLSGLKAGETVVDQVLFLLDSDAAFRGRYP